MSMPLDRAMYGRFGTQAQTAPDGCRCAGIRASVTAPEAPRRRERLMQEWQQELTSPP